VYSFTQNKAVFCAIFTNVVATLSGNSIAMMAKLAVRKAALPNASTIRITNDNMING
jgi:hypothetical protein